MTLEASIRSEATRLGVDLLGIAPVSRWDKAPKEHSPQAVMPEARNVIVCGIHFLDAPTELGAEDDPREPGPAMTEMNVSHMLHEVAWSLCKLLDRQGHRANFVRQSGQWRYRASGEDRGWVGDICHYYAAVCAGLGEVGWNNITLSEKFGPRQRWVSIITDADLPPTPLYDGPPLCDRCKLCAKHCPTQSFTKDVSGEMRHIEVERHRYEFPDRNLWRCAIGENFMLDVFLDKWKDQEVTEDLIKAMQEKAVYENNDMVKGWKMGMCLKHCMPPHRRYFDPDYCKAPRRRRDVQVDPSPAALARAQQDILAHAGEWGVDMIAAASAEALTEAGIDLREVMPDAESLLVLGIGYPAQCMLNSDYVAAKAEIMVAS
ncbi:MAG: hypothetical protein KGY81_09045, partial [Phycisphaerae bacterium]|nr:hypothetical protein [Phycisphaerae bacterium]